MTLNPYLLFAGDCEAAFRSYHRCLDGRIDAMLRYGETPACEDAAPDWHDKIVHARLQTGSGSVLMGSDAPPGHQQRAQGFAVSLNVDDPAEAERVFAALSDGGTVQMPMEETFFAWRFGMLTDPFGIPWMIGCQKECTASDR